MKLKSVLLLLSIIATNATASSDPDAEFLATVPVFAIERASDALNCINAAVVAYAVKERCKESEVACLHATDRAAMAITGECDLSLKECVRYCGRWAVLAPEAGYTHTETIQEVLEDGCVAYTVR